MTTGRKTVAPGQTIASEWGNLVWDQSTQNFATTADRNTQWPAPLDGAICYTAAEKTWWVRVGGVWKPLFNDWPSPPVWRATRPTTDSIAGGTWGTAVTATIPNAKPGSYAAHGTAAVSSAGNCYVRIYMNGAVLSVPAGYNSTLNLNSAFAPLSIAGHYPNWAGGNMDWTLQFGFTSGANVTIYTGSYLQVTYLGPN